MASDNIYLKVWIVVIDSFSESGECGIASTIAPLLSISDFATV